jgi:hypothetical protein
VRRGGKEGTSRLSRSQIGQKMALGTKLTHVEG